MSSKIDKLEAVRQALVRCEQFTRENSTMATEKIECNVDVNSQTKVSTIRYEGPDGKFTVKYNPGKKNATADANFITGRFRATVTEDTCTTKGVEPVYHPFWGVLHEAFSQK